MDHASMESLEVELKDGTPVALRLCRPDDPSCDMEWRRAALAAGFDRLSMRSRALRFFSPLPRLSAHQLDYLTDVDNADRVVWFAQDASHTDRPGIGLARYVRLPDEPDAAEFAVTVIDAYQNLGLGTRLLELLIASAQDHGIRIMRASVLTENLPMLKILQRLGARIREAGGALLEAEIAIKRTPGGR